MIAVEIWSPGVHLDLTEVRPHVVRDKAGEVVSIGITLTRDEAVDLQKRLVDALWALPSRGGSDG